MPPAYSAHLRSPSTRHLAAGIYIYYIYSLSYTASFGYPPDGICRQAYTANLRIPSPIISQPHLHIPYTRQIHTYHHTYASLPSLGRDIHIIYTAYHILPPSEAYTAHLTIPTVSPGRLYRSRRNARRMVYAEGIHSSITTSSLRFVARGGQSGSVYSRPIDSAKIRSSSLIDRRE